MSTHSSLTVRVQRPRAASSDSGRRSASTFSDREQRPQTAAAIVADDQVAGCRRRQIMARTLSKDSRATSALARLIAPTEARSLRWLSTSLADA